jgi:hypothetical protein
MISNDAFVQTICGALEQAGVKLMYDATVVVRDNLSVEYTRGGKIKVVGHGKVCMERKNAVLAAEVATVFGADLVVAARDLYYKELCLSFVATAQAKLHALLTLAGVGAKQKAHGYSTRSKADRYADGYRAEGQAITFMLVEPDYSSDEMPVSCRVDCRLPLAALDAPEYWLNYTVTSGPGRNTRQDEVREKIDGLADLVPGLERAKAKVKNYWDKRIAARNTLTRFQTACPSDKDAWRPALSLDVVADEYHDNHVDLRIIAHVTSDKLADCVRLSAASAPAEFLGMLSHTAHAVHTNAIGWKLDSPGSDQMHLYTGHGAYDLSLSSRYDRKDVILDGSTATLVCFRFSGSLVLEDAIAFAQHLYSICPEISRR